MNKQMFIVYDRSKFAAKKGTITYRGNRIGDFYRGQTATIPKGTRTY